MEKNNKKEVILQKPYCLHGIKADSIPKTSAVNQTEYEPRIPSPTKKIIRIKLLFLFYKTESSIFLKRNSQVICFLLYLVFVFLQWLQTCQFQLFQHQHSRLLYIKIILPSQPESSLMRPTIHYGLKS